MRSNNLFFSLVLVLFFMPMTVALSADDSPVYELRVYTCEPGKLEALHSRFRNHTMKIFEKHGIKNIAYWTPTEGDKASNTLVYLLEHKSRAAADESWMGFRNDAEWKAVAAKSREDHGKILAHKPESTYMVANDYSPAIKPVDHTDTYELRVYTTNPGKLELLNARFGGGEVAIFHRVGMNSVGYWTPQDAPASKNTLVYMLQHKTRDDAKKSWQAFVSDAEWKEMRAETEKDGKFLSQRPESMFLKPTDYSPKPTH